MKKFLAMMVSLTMLISFAACSVDESKEVASGGTGSGTVSVSKIADEQGNIFSEDEVLEKLTTVSYTWNEGPYYYLALVVKNNSEVDCELTANVVFKNAENAIIGSETSSIRAFESNSEVCMVFSNEDEFASFDYSYDAAELGYYECVVSDLSCEASIASDKAIISVTNNGDKVADSVSYRILYFSGENVVGSRWGYAHNDEGNLEPGKMVVEEDRLYGKKFDSIKVYLDAYIYNY